MNNQPVIVFDGVCNLCNTAVQSVLKNDKNAYFSFASLQGEFGQKLLKEYNLNSEDFDSFLFLENKVLYSKSTAALRVAKKMDYPFKLLYPLIFIPKFIRDGIYSFIANNRYRWFGKRDSCMMPDPQVQQRFIP